MKFSRLLSVSSSKEGEGQPEDRQNLFDQFTQEFSDKELTHYGFPVDPFIKDTKVRLHKRLLCGREGSAELQLVDDAPPSPSAGSLPNSFYQLEQQPSQQPRTGLEEDSLNSFDPFKVSTEIFQENSIKPCHAKQNMTARKRVSDEDSSSLFYSKNDIHRQRNMNTVRSKENLPTIKSNSIKESDPSKDQPDHNRRSFKPKAKISSFAIPDISHIYQDLETDLGIGNIPTNYNPRDDPKTRTLASISSEESSTFFIDLDGIVESGLKAIRSRPTSHHNNVGQNGIMIFQDEDPDVMEHPFSPSPEKEPSCPDDEWCFYYRNSSKNTSIIDPSHGVVSPLRHQEVNTLPDADNHSYGVQRKGKIPQKKDNQNRFNTTAMPPQMIVLPEGEEDIPMSPMLSSPSIQRAYPTHSLLDSTNEKNDAEIPDSPLRVQSQAQLRLVPTLQHASAIQQRGEKRMEVKNMRQAINPMTQPKDDANNAPSSIQNLPILSKQETLSEQASVNTSISSLTTPAILLKKNEDDPAGFTAMQHQATIAPPYSSTKHCRDENATKSKSPFHTGMRKLKCLANTRRSNLLTGRAHLVTPTEDENHHPIRFEFEI